MSVNSRTPRNVRPTPLAERIHRYRVHLDEIHVGSRNRNLEEISAEMRHSRVAHQGESSVKGRSTHPTKSLRLWCKPVSEYGQPLVSQTRAKTIRTSFGIIQGGYTLQNIRIRIRHIHTLQFRSLPLPPYEDKREQHEIHRMGYDLRDFEAHVTRFSEYAASYSAMG
jgi:hypothetical protein